MKALGLLIGCMALSVSAFAAASQTAPTSLITVEFKDASLQSAVDALFRGTGRSFVIDSAVEKNKAIPTVSLRDVTLDEALKAVVRAAGVTYRRDSDSIYLILPKSASQPVVPPPPPLPEIESQVKVDQKVDKIALNFIDAQDVAMIFGASAFHSRGSALVMGGSGATGSTDGTALQQGGGTTPMGSPMQNNYGFNNGQNSYLRSGQSVQAPVTVTR